MVSELVDLPTCPGMAEGADGKQPQPSRAMELLEEFNNLSQGDSLEEYNEPFGELRLWLLSINPYLRESYFIWCYIKGLKLKIKSLVHLGRPKELEEAMKLAALHNKSATQELANPKPNSSISTLTETEIPNSMSKAIDVLGEGQTIQESSERELEVLADGVLGESELEAEEEATKFTQVEETSELKAEVLLRKVLGKSGGEPINVGECEAEVELTKEFETPFGGSVLEIDSQTQLVNGSKELQHRKVISSPLPNAVGKVPSKEFRLLVNLLIELMEIRVANFRINSIDFVRNPTTFKVFEKLPNRREVLCDQSVYTLVKEENSTSSNMDIIAISCSYDRGKCKHGVGTEQGLSVNMEGVFSYFQGSIRQNLIFKPYDKGKKPLRPEVEKVHIDFWIVALDKRGFSFVFDPGGTHGGLFADKFLASHALFC